MAGPRLTSKIRVRFKNLTSKTSVIFGIGKAEAAYERKLEARKSKRPKRKKPTVVDEELVAFLSAADERPDPARFVEFVEISEEAIILDVPLKSCNEGHRLEMTFLAAGPDGPKVEGAGVVQDYFGSDGRARITVSDLNVSRKEWAALLDSLRELQEKADELFKNVKGL